jgi:hypothetical protein
MRGVQAEVHMPDWDESVIVCQMGAAPMHIDVRHLKNQSLNPRVFHWHGSVLVCCQMSSGQQSRLEGFS